MKRTIKLILARLRLLDIAQKLLIVKRLKSSKDDNDLFLKENPEFVPPPAWLLYDANDNNSYRSYYQSGKEHGQIVAELIKKYYGGNVENLLEWGSGQARVLRHFPHLLPGSRLYGTDYNQKSINWCKAQFKNINFTSCDLLPPTSYSDNFFDVIYSISIFTHLSENAHTLWIKELYRLLKPGGILVSSFHGENYYDLLTEDEKQLFDKGLLVTRPYAKEGSKLYSTFHSKKFLRQLFHEFEIIDIKNDLAPVLVQSLWVAKKI